MDTPLYKEINNLIKNNNMEICNLIKKNQMELCNLIKKNQMEICRVQNLLILLLEHGANINQQTESGLTFNSQENFQELSEDENSTTGSSESNTNAKLRDKSNCVCIFLNRKGNFSQGKNRKIMCVFCGKHLNTKNDKFMHTMSEFWSDKTLPKVEYHKMWNSLTFKEKQKKVEEFVKNHPDIHAHTTVATKKMLGTFSCCGKKKGGDKKKNKYYQNEYKMILDKFEELRKKGFMDEAIIKNYLGLKKYKNLHKCHAESCRKRKRLKEINEENKKRNIYFDC